MVKVKKLVIIEEDEDIEIVEKDVDVGEYENRMIGYAESTKGFAIEQTRSNKRVEVPLGRVSFVLGRKKENKGEDENG